MGAGGDGTQVPTPHPLQHSHHDLAPTPTEVMLANHEYMLFSFVLPPLGAGSRYLLGQARQGGHAVGTRRRGCGGPLISVALHRQPFVRLCSFLFFFFLLAIAGQEGLQAKREAIAVGVGGVDEMFMLSYYEVSPFHGRFSDLDVVPSLPLVAPTPRLCRHLWDQARRNTETRGGAGGAARHRKQ